MIDKISKKSLINMKKVYDVLDTHNNTFQEKSLAEICYLLDLDYKKKKNSIIKNIDSLCELGFKMTERETENNIYIGILPSDNNLTLYKTYLSNI